MLTRFLDQERAPIFTVLSLFATILTLAFLVLIFAETRKPADWGAPMIPLLLLASGVMGALVNGGIGMIAAKRGELKGGTIAGVCAALCFITAVVLVALAVSYIVH